VDYFFEVDFYLIGENLVFLVASTLFLGIVGWTWRNTKPYHLPEPLPMWFMVWFGTVQLFGGILPFVALGLWGVWWGYASVVMVLIPYLVLLGLQILAEIIALRQFHTVVWVMIPYVYVPYRVWQLYEGLERLEPIPALFWVRVLLWVNVVMWIGNYFLDLAQLPRLLFWPRDRELTHNSEKLPDFTVYHD
jgi:hypothetical protein